MRPKNIGGESLWGRIKIAPDRYEIISHCDEKWLQFRAILIAKYSGETPLRSHHTQCARLLVYTLFLNKFPDRSTTIIRLNSQGELESLTMNICMLCAVPRLYRYKICLKTVQDDNYTRTESNTKSITWLRLYTRACNIASTQRSRLHKSRVSWRCFC